MSLYGGLGGRLAERGLSRYQHTALEGLSRLGFLLHRRALGVDASVIFRGPGFWILWEGATGSVMRSPTGPTWVRPGLYPSCWAYLHNSVWDQFRPGLGGKGWMGTLTESGDNLPRLGLLTMCS